MLCMHVRGHAVRPPGTPRAVVRVGFSDRLQEAALAARTLTDGACDPAFGATRTGCSRRALWGTLRCALAERVTPISARSASVAAGRGGSGSGRLLAVTPRVVEANHLPPVPEQRAHRADRCDGHLPATMTTCAVDGDEKGCASHAVDRQGAGHWTLLQPSLFAENRPSREGGVIARWWEEDGIEREPCRDDNALPCAAVPDGEQDERC